MNWIFFLVLFVASVVYSFAQDSADVSKETPVYESRNPKVSSEFGYNIQSSDNISSHFRQEQRDPNGVVRGSYGFKNPNGGFRFVQYVADDKGFRAHISSNENGIGKQNPASVSINRFKHQPAIEGQLYESKPPILREKLQNSGLRSQVTELQPYALDTYPSIQHEINSGTNGNTNIYSFSADGNESQNHFHNRNKHQFIIPQLNPVERVIKTRLGIPDELFAVRRTNGNIPDWIRNPTISEYISTEEVASSRTRISQRKNIFQPYQFFGSHNADTLGDNYSRSRLRLNNNFKDPQFTYPQFLSKLLPSEQQKVHTSLPDCDSASSAVLCKPPPLLSGSSSQQDIRRFPETIFDRFHQTLPPGSFLSESNFEAFEGSHYPSEDEVHDTTPHLMPNSYPLRFNIYKSFIEQKQQSEKILREDRECSSKKNMDKNDAAEDFLPSPDSHRFVKDAISKDWRLYNEKESSYLNSYEPYPQVDRYHNEKTYIPSLVKIIQNNNSLNTLKHLMTTEQNNKNLSPNLLGIIILPSHLIKELNRDDVDIPKPKEIEYSEEKKESLLHNVTSESGVKDQNKSHVEEVYENRSNTELNKSIYSEEKNSSKDSVSRNGTKHLSDSADQISINADKHILQSSNNTERSLLLSNSRFFVFDDAAEYSSQDEMKTAFNKNSSSDDWRKILEGEISKEMERTSLQKEVPKPDIPIGLENSGKKSDQSQYMLNEHTGPLYDSTGRPIKPENVPLHIHRYIPPTGITSFPWKFSIPRPAPPRSIVVPPKPLTFS